MIESLVDPLLMAWELLIAGLLFGRILNVRNNFKFRVIASFFICLEVVVFMALLYMQVTGSMFDYNNSSEFDLGQVYLSFSTIL